MFKEMLKRHRPAARRLMAVPAGLSCVLLIAACGSDNSSSSGASSSSASSKAAAFKIGIPTPLTGCCPSQGEDMKAAAQLAAEEVNKAGGIAGHKIQLDVQDDACEAQQGVQAAQKLVQDGVIAVVGAYCSAAALPQEDVFKRAGGIPFILPSASNPQLTDPGNPNISRVNGRDDQEGPADARYIQQIIKPSSVAILHDNSEFSLSIGKQIKQTLGALGTKVVFFDAVTPGGKDYRAALERVKRSGADLLYYAGQYPEFGIIAKQWHAGQYPFKLVGNAADIDASVFKVAPEAVKSPKLSLISYPNTGVVTGPEVERYRAAYKARFGRDPEAISVFMYDSMKVLFEALKANPDDVSKTALSQRIRQVDMPGITGRIQFNAKGDRPLLPFYAVRYDGSKLVQVAELTDGKTWKPL